ncbi:MAG: (d)CMP kinase [Faecalibacterium sp.]|nr:(d)CMP kinase [Ruminococcus sp.]MCM1393017.1 (d)CMP kinase [Ruminococcus sp.]MCM1486087.1 (d)CMP kinase [Faecalibacterium sp.]
MINVAIDGPAGAGKSTIARKAASVLGYIYIDTGALYRTVGLAAMRAGKDLESPESIASVLTDELSVELRFVDGEQRMFLNGEDVSTDIRTPEASTAASRVSAVPKVREYLFDLQKKMANENNCIMDGRDIGTVVLPDAKVKIFLTASAEARAQRRFKELTEKGMDVKYDDVLADMIERDYNDSHRAIAPLKQADDAILCDTSNINLEQSIELIINTIRENI